MSDGAAWAGTTNGTSHSDLRAPHGSDIASYVPAVLGRMNGSRLFAWSIWRLPDGRTTVEGLDLRRWPQEYVQAAGAADGMVVEIRREVEPGVHAHDAVGRDVPDARLLPREQRVAWDRYEVPAATNEVLRAEEASEVFLAYHGGEGLPAGYVLRPAALHGDQSED